MGWQKSSLRDPSTWAFTGLFALHLVSSRVHCLGGIMLPVAKPVANATEEAPCREVGLQTCHPLILPLNNEPWSALMAESLTLTLQ